MDTVSALGQPLLRRRLVFPHPGVGSVEVLGFYHLHPDTKGVSDHSLIKTYRTI